MAQAGRAVIGPTEESGSGASGVDLDVPFSLQASGKGALTHHSQADGGTACGSRAFSGSLMGPAPAIEVEHWLVLCYTLT